MCAPWISRGLIAEQQRMPFKSAPATKFRCQEFNWFIMARRPLMKCWCHQISHCSFGESSGADPTSTRRMAARGRVTFVVAMWASFQSEVQCSLLCFIYCFALCVMYSIRVQSIGKTQTMQYGWAACFLFGFVWVRASTQKRPTLLALFTQRPFCLSCHKGSSYWIAWIFWGSSV